MDVTVAEAEKRLHDAPWRHDPALQAMMAALDGAAGRTRIVGGIVRDTLIGRVRTGGDIDLATELVPTDVIARAARAGMQSYPTGIAHGTVTLRHGDLVCEVTTLREDVETDGRHAVVRFGTDWRRDAARRDFTLNALYANADGTLFDPLGGLADCLAQRVRFIGDADARIAEDRLRVYRFFRFSASHGGQSFDAQGLAACRRAADALGQVSAERVGAEMLRMLALPRVAETLKAMSEAGVAQWPAPLLARLARHEDHAPTLAGRLALYAEALGLETIRTRWRLSNALCDAARDALSAARAILDARTPDKGLAIAAYRYPGAVHDGVEVAIALGPADAARAAQLRALPIVHPPAFPLRGGDLIAAGLSPGRAVGLELARLEQLWIESGFALDRSHLLAMAEAQQPAP